MGIYQVVSSSRTYIFVVIASTTVVGWAMNMTASGFRDLENKEIPDVGFGFTSDSIGSLYNSWGEVGRSTYYRLNTLDFMFMPCYTVLLGSLLVLTAQMSGSRSPMIDFTPISTITALCDVIETTTLRRALVLFPVLIDEREAQIGSLAQQMKWIALSLNVFLILVLGCKGLFAKKKSKLN